MPRHYKIEKDIAIAESSSSLLSTTWDVPSSLVDCVLMTHTSDLQPAGQFIGGSHHKWERELAS